MMSNETSTNAGVAPTASTSGSVARVVEALDAAGIDAEVRHFDESTRTAADAAAALGVLQAQIAKTLVFLADGAPIIVVMGGDDRVDTEALGAALDGATIGRADADSVRSGTGFAIGGVSPAGLPRGLTVLVDRSLSEVGELWAAAGTPKSVYRTSYGELLSVTGGREVSVAQR
jgi:prolyl-tRNA editing enzyme YbaK/EbsC (Cys-tRNA(Pro) deacylase)